MEDWVSVELEQIELRLELEASEPGGADDAPPF